MPSLEGAWHHKWLTGKGITLAESRPLRTPSEWEVIYGVKVVDPDGWSHGTYQSWGTPISREEWERRLSTSTVDRSQRRESNRG